MNLRLYKKEKLCSATAIDALFAPGSGALRAMAFPVRAVWRENGSRHADCPQFLIMVPKQRLRHAVDRVTMRRRIREAYRLNRHLFPSDRRVDIAFIYVASELRPYSDVERGVTRVLRQISRSLTADETPRAD